MRDYIEMLVTARASDAEVIQYIYYCNSSGRTIRGHIPFPTSVLFVPPFGRADTTEYFPALPSQSCNNTHIYTGHQADYFTLLCLRAGVVMSNCSVDQPNEGML